MKQKLKIEVKVGVFLNNKTEVLICVTTFWNINVYEKKKILNLAHSSSLTKKSFKFN